MTAEPLRSDTYRDELADVARGDDTGPHPIPTDEQIDAVLGDLPDHDEVPAVEETA